MHDLLHERFDDDAGVVRRARRRPGTAPATATRRFCYPELAAPAAPAPAAPELPARTFSEEELARALEAARREVSLESAATVRAELAASLEQRHTEALGAVAAQLAAAGSALERTLAARVNASRDLALALARALVPRALGLQPLADVEAMLHSLVLRLEGQPWLEVGLPPALLAAGEAVLARVAADAGYQGELRVVPEPGLGSGDARVRWHEGAAERDLARIEAEAVALVEVWLPDDANQAQEAPAQPMGACTKEAEI